MVGSQARQGGRSHPVPETGPGLGRALSWLHQFCTSSGCALHAPVAGPPLLTHAQAAATHFKEELRLAPCYAAPTSYLRTHPPTHPPLQDLVEAGALCVTNAYIVDWLVRPRAALGGHVLLGSEAGAAGGRALAAERRRGSVKGLEVEQHGEEEEPLSPIL